MGTTTTDIWNEHFPALADDRDPALQRLRSSARLVQLPAGTPVFTTSGTCENYLLVVSGRVRVELLAASGRQIVLYHVEAGQSCVLTTSCLLAGKPYPAEGLTETDVSALVIGRAVFDELIEESAAFRQFVFATFSARLAAIIAKIEDVAFEPIDTRLARALIDIDHSDNGIRTTHQELAAEIGTAREVVSRHLKAFEAKGWVRLNRGEITILDPAALQTIAE